MTNPAGQPGGPGYWRSLAERADTAEFREALQREFVPGASQWPDRASRRAFLEHMTASLALAGMAGCGRQPEEQIVPYVQEPEHIVPGRPRFFASAMPTPGGALGVLVRSNDGRPTKIEGNPEHPDSRGATDAFAQAAVLELYDPLRSRVVRKRGQVSRWDRLAATLAGAMEQHRAARGAGLHIVLPPTTSPTLLAQLGRLLAALPETAWYEYAAFSHRATRSATTLAFGRELTPRYDLSRADVILALDADFVADEPGNVRLIRQFAARRKAIDSADAPIRLYAAESTVTLTGASAEHRLPLSPGGVSAVVEHVAAALGLEVLPAAELSDETRRWVDAAVADLRSAASRALVMAGPSLSPRDQALVIAVNDRLGAAGSTVQYLEPLDRPPGGAPREMSALVDALRSGAVQTLVLAGVNPVYHAPPGAGLAEAIRKAPLSIHHGLFEDETASVCTWHVAAAHWLESWSDVRSDDGTASIVQPLIAPLYDGKSLHELFTVLLGEPARSAYDLVRETWRAARDAAAFDPFWHEALRTGVIPDSAAAPVLNLPTGEALSARVTAIPQEQLAAERPTTGDGARRWELVFRPDPHIADGRYATNRWLQELPRPFTKLTWLNAALVSPATSAALKLADGDVVELAQGGRAVELPVMAVPGHPDATITLYAGYGRPDGVSVAPLRATWSSWSAAGATIRLLGTRVVLPTTQHEHLMHGRDIVRSGTLAEYRRAPDHPPFMQSGHGHGAGGGHEPPSLYPTPPREPVGPQWGMSVNLSACVGCNACVIACQAENNIPTVGPEEVARGRVMHWLRIDTYYHGAEQNPEVLHQPVMCMHCEHAPCEVVCPVAATTHSDEGLNEMTYNRCVGTRYCSNNCPYKVRRFNFLDYHADTKQLPVIELLHNPNVTVRSRGVMEKCTYCVQRISAARIRAEIENRDMRDGEVVTACQAACPAQAIQFGNTADPASAVSRAKAHSLDYGLLEELNTRPRTSYLAAVRNPNPALPQPADDPARSAAPPRG